MQFAIVSDGVVTNIVDADAAFAKKMGWIDAGNSRIGDIWDGKTFTPPPPPAPTTAELVALIDIQTDAIYGAVLGNRAAEYELAESEAATYKAAGYPATAPPSVASWAAAKGWTNRQASDDIITTATAWRGAMSAIRAKRLAYKQAATSPDPMTRTKAGTEWAGFVAYIKNQLGIPT